MVDVPLRDDAAGTAQSLRAVINADPDAAGVIASGDSNVLTISAVAYGPAGAAIGLSASAAQPVASDATLQPTSKIKTLIGGLVSDLRGVVTLFYDGLIATNNPYPKPWSVRVKRTTAGWFGGEPWYSNRATILLADNTIRAMNPAHIIYQCMTDPTWGRGLPAASFYLPSFVSAANTLYTEGFGLCMKWSKQTDIDEFIQSVVSHIGAALYVDRSTGLFTLRLIRGGYDEETLPVFTYDSGVLEVSEDDSTSGDNSHNEIIVKWKDPNTNDERQTRYQNLAAIQASGAVTSLTVEYPGIPTSGLAARVAQRDLAAKAGGIRRMKLVLDRRGRKIAPGGVFRLSLPSRGIANIVLRAGSVEEGKQVDPKITVVAVEDVFALPSTTYVTEQPGTWVPPDVSVSAPGTRRWRELSYRDLVRALAPAELAAVPVDAGYVAVAAKQPSSLSTDYVLATAGDGEDYVNRGVRPWTPTATLTFAIGAYTTDLVLTMSGDRLGPLGTTPLSAWIDNEVVAVTAYSQTTGLMTVARGCLDTIPVPHAAGARLWFPDLAMGSDNREYSPGETVRLKVLTRSNGQQLALGDAFEDEVLISGRQGRPYPPGNLRVNGERFADGIEATGEVVLTWAHRDRLLQADVLLAHGEASVGPEAGTTYTVRIYDGATEIRETTGITGTTWTYTYAMMDADGPITDLKIAVESVRDGLVSTYGYLWAQPHADIGFGRGYGLRYGESV